MAHPNIARERLHNQLIANPTFDKSSDVVNWFGALQAQDYLGALWAVGLRTQDANEKEIEQALANRTIVRTWPMRGTLHFVAADDVRWMLALLTPRVIAGSASRWKQLELDEATFSRSRKTIERALQGGKQLEREEMYQVLESTHISTTGQRGIHILGRLAQEGVICFGARAGKQHTFVLLDEWVPKSKRMERDAALTELAKRYFTSHGPATLQDFVWWSGLATNDAREGLELAKARLTQEVVAGQTYWFSAATPITKTKPQTASAYLLPGFDEYLVGYKDRSAVLDPLYVMQTNAGGGMLNPTIVVNGQVIGTWKRTLQKDTVVITPSWFAAPKKSDQRMLKAARQYGAFLGLSAMLV
ncbi:MAG: AlkZ family DNA glycosylase [Chloroflexi bacterium]|nr:AlkZ family DNA glycosylase [Chloroflexota bacterium]